MLSNTNIEKCRARIKEVSTKALETESYYVLCFWESPITNQIESRVGYFENGVEAEFYKNTLVKVYRDNLKLPYQIESNVSYIGTVYGGLT